MNERELKREIRELKKKIKSLEEDLEQAKFDRDGYEADLLEANREISER